MPWQTSNQFVDPLSTRNTADDEIEAVTCEKCGCKWMELIAVQRFSKNRSVIIGQKPAAYTDVGFWLFRCPKCLEVYEPSLISAGPQDTARRLYDNFLDQMAAADKKISGESV